MGGCLCFCTPARATNHHHDHDTLESCYHVLGLFHLHPLFFFSPYQLSFDLSEYTANVDGVGTLRLLDAIRTCGLESKVKFYQVGVLPFFSSAYSKQYHYCCHITFCTVDVLAERNLGPLKLDTPELQLFQAKIKHSSDNHVGGFGLPHLTPSLETFLKCLPSLRQLVGQIHLS